MTRGSGLYTRAESARSAVSAPLRAHMRRARALSPGDHATCAEPGLSARALFDSQLGRARGLIPDVRHRAIQVAHAERPKIVAGRPPQPRPRHVAVAIGDPRARALQSLNEARQIGTY